MNYDERISALTSFKSTVSSAGDTVDGVSGVSSEVSGWEGDAKTRFDEYIEVVKGDAASLSGKKAQFLTDIQGQIDAIKSQMASEVAQYTYITQATYDSKSSTKNKSLKKSAIRNLNVDSSVKKRLLNMI